MFKNQVTNFVICQIRIGNPTKCRITTAKILQRNEVKTIIYNRKPDIPGEYFPMPKSIFRLGLTSGEILVYTYLMYCEDRKTFQCHPSYATIGEAVGMSNNTVKKYVDTLERKGLIYTEHTTVKTRDGRTHNGSLLYTLQPLKPIEEAYFDRQLREAQARFNAQTALKQFDLRRERTSK